MSNARRQQNLPDSGARHASDGIRSGRMGEDMVRRIQDSFGIFGLFILSDPKPNVTVIVLMMSVPVLARQSIPGGHLMRE